VDERGPNSPSHAPPGKEPPAPALGGADEQHRLLMGCVTDYALFFLDPHGNVATWNAGAERTFGYPEAEIVGQHSSCFFTAEDVQQGQPSKESQTAADTGQASDDRWMVRQGGARLWCNGVTTALRDATGRLRGFAKVLRDRTEPKWLEEALHQRAEQLADEGRRKDEFLAVLAHELRNPLAPIRTGLDRIRLKVPPDSPLLPVVDLVERQVGQMTRLLDNLLDVSRITGNRVELRKERVDLHAVIAQAVETARPLLDARQHTLTYTPSPEPLPLEADPTRLAQALSNILGNAAKYSEDGGRIGLTAGRDQGEAVVKVRDTGIGIAPELLPKVFDLFTQASGSLDRSQGGLGVGLTVARRLVEMHGGSVTAHSAGEGQGSEFVLRLPLVLESRGVDPEGVRGGGKTPPGETARHRILLVDDVVEVAEDLAALVREAFGHEVRTAHDGPTALRVAADFRPELVLLDIGLPGMSGYEVARRLRELPGLGDAVLVVLTGWGQAGDRRKAKEAGFDHHLVKPVGLQELQPLLAGLKPAEGGDEGH
jgi:PAS domain S-box-containing protein